MSDNLERLPAAGRRSDHEAAFMLEQSGMAPVEEVGLTPRERKLLAEFRRKEQERKERERERTKERSTRRLDLDLADDLKQRLVRVAEEEDVSLSSVVTYLLYEGMRQVDAGSLNVRRYKYASGGGRHRYVVVHPDDKRRAEMTPGRAPTASGWDNSAGSEKKGENSGTNGTPPTHSGATWGAQ